MWGNSGSRTREAAGQKGQADFFLIERGLRACAVRLLRRRPSPVLRASASKPMAGCGMWNARSICWRGTVLAGG